MKWKQEYLRLAETNAKLRPTVALLQAKLDAANERISALKRERARLREQLTAPTTR